MNKRSLNYQFQQIKSCQSIKLILYAVELNSMSNAKHSNSMSHSLEHGNSEVAQTEYPQTLYFKIFLIFQISAFNSRFLRHRKSDFFKCKKWDFLVFTEFNFYKSILFFRQKRVNRTTKTNHSFIRTKGTL